jgi:hypothetical protein
MLQPFSYIAKMQRPHRFVRPMTFYDDKLAQGEEIIKNLGSKRPRRDVQTYYNRLCLSLS